MHTNHYSHLLIMTILSFIAMFVLMYAMVDRFGNVYPNLNQVYMAALMAAPMPIIELLVMRGMYENKRTNTIVLASSVVALLAFFTLIRQQTAIGDGQFLKSMIPHHAGAILMCEKAVINDQKIKQLCQEIIASQQSEINQMKAMLSELKSRG